MPHPVHRIGHADRIFRLFEHAAIHLKQPGISLRMPAFSLRIELHQQGVLKLSNVFHSRRDRVWYGDLRDGTYDPRTADAKNVAIVLRHFARDPMAMARNHGYRTGYCCFCGPQVTDEERIDQLWLWTNLRQTLGVAVGEGR